VRATNNVIMTKIIFMRDSSRDWFKCTCVRNLHGDETRIPGSV